MNKIENFQQFLANQSNQIPVFDFILSLFMAAFLAFILSKIYIKYGASLSNRRMFAKNFMLLTVTTMMIITVVKSSLALSLGLVGALSIVRFRAAIKEPEELTYLFLAISIGLGIGANQRIITLVGFGSICAIIIISKEFSPNLGHNKNLYLTIASNNPSKFILEQIIQTLKKYCSIVDIKRFDENKEMLEVSFAIELDNIEQLQTIKSGLQRLDDSVTITFLDNRESA